MIIRVIFVFGLLLSAGMSFAAELVVFAAASLKGPLDEIAAEFGDVVVSYAGSGVLARQATYGAPADVVILANVAWMDALVVEGAVVGGVDILSNRLVVVGRGSAGDLPDVLGEGRVAMGFVEAVPAGIYAKSALEALGLWEGVAPRVVQVDNVRAALALVDRGEVPLGIVYASDVQIAPSLDVLAVFPANSHAPIRYLAAVVSQSENADAVRFLDVLQGEMAQARFAEAGFLPRVEP